jgi:hypothetical protein
MEEFVKKRSFRTKAKNALSYVISALPLSVVYSIPYGRHHGKRLKEMGDEITEHAKHYPVKGRNVNVLKGGYPELKKIYGDFAREKKFFYGHSAALGVFDAFYTSCDSVGLDVPDWLRLVCFSASGLFKLDSHNDFKKSIKAFDESAKLYKSELMW